MNPTGSPTRPPPALTADDLRAFEAGIADLFNASAIRAPVHLAAGNETALIDYFRENFDAVRGDWVASAWRSHHHALLAGVPPAEVRAQILLGRSITLTFPRHRFITSAIVGGVLPIALGLALAAKRRAEAHGVPPDAPPPYRVHAFVGDMTAMTGAYHEVREYAYGHNLPLNLIVEDNGRSVGTPTLPVWGDPAEHSPGAYAATGPREFRHVHDNPWPHAGAGRWVRF